MESISISGSVRKSLGKADAKVLRREGQVPCIIYGGAENIHFNLEERAFNKLINTPNVYIVNVELDGKTHASIIKDVQFHPLTDKVVHVDFQQLQDGKAVNLSLPIRTVGVSPGVLNGGKLNQVLRRAKVSGNPYDMPDYIDINISKLRIGRSIKVKDVKVKGVTFRENENQILVAIKAKRGAKVGDDAEEDAPEAEGAEASSADAAVE